MGKVKKVDGRIPGQRFNAGSSGGKIIIDKAILSEKERHTCSLCGKKWERSIRTVFHRDGTRSCLHDGIAGKMDSVEMRMAKGNLQANEKAVEHDGVVHIVENG